MTYEIHFKHDIGDDVWIVKKNFPLRRAIVSALVYEQTKEQGEKYFYEVRLDGNSQCIRVYEDEAINATNPNEALSAILHIANPL